MRLFDEMLAGLALAWRILTTDSQVRAVAIFAPIVLSLVSPLPYLGEVARDIPIAVVDLDRSDTSRTFSRLLSAHESVRATSLPSLAEARVAFYRREVQGAVLVPFGFERSLYRGESALLASYSDASYFLVNRQVANGVADVAGAASQGLSEYRLQAAGLSPYQAQAILVPIQTSASALFNAAGNYAVYQVPALLVVIVQMTLLSAVGAALGAAREAERDLGLAAPGRLIGLSLGFAAVGVSLLLLLQILMPRWYGYESRAHVMALAAAAAPFMLATASLGMFCGAWFRRREAASLCFVFLSMPLFMLAGYAWPREAMPDWLRWLAHMSPSTMAIDAFIRLDQMGASVRDVGAELAGLWALAFAYLMLAIGVHRWRPGSLV